MPNKSTERGALARQKPTGRAVRLNVFPRDWDLADEFAQARIQEPLERMLADLVADIATAAERPDSWEAQKLWAWLDSRYRPAHQLFCERNRREEAW